MRLALKDGLPNSQLRFVFTVKTRLGKFLVIPAAPFRSSLQNVATIFDHLGRWTTMAPRIGGVLM